MNIYTVKDTDIVHNTSVDFVTRWCAKEVHIVQYDDAQPIVAVELFRNSVKYILPEGYEANLRFGKKDRTFIYKPVLGCNTERDTVYFVVDEQMSLLYGKVNPIIELTYNGAVVGSSPIPFVVDRNPVQVGDLQSKSDYPAIVERLSIAETNASDAKKIAQDVESKFNSIDDRYAVKTELNAEAAARVAGDTKTLSDAKAYADSLLGGSDLSQYATKVALNEEIEARKAADTKFLNDANAYCDGAIARLNIGTYASTEALNKEATTRAENDDQVLQSAKTYTDNSIAVKTVGKEFSIDQNKQLTLAKVSTDLLENGTSELILDGGTSD